MQIVIDISEKLYKDIQDNILFGDDKNDAIWDINGAIINGTVLSEENDTIR